MEPKVGMVMELLGNGIRQAADTHLETVPVLDQGSAVLAYGDILRRRSGKFLCYQGRIVIDKIIELVDVQQIAV